MASPSKEDQILKLILENSPLKEWHFEEIVKKTKVTRGVANKWLKKCESTKLIKRIKPRGKFPHFTVGPTNPQYLSLKKIYALQQLHNSGLLPKLISLKNCQTIIIFGSIARGDWYKDSDIDIFIFGDPDFNKGIYERKLGRHIELHIFANRREISDIKTGIIKNIANGHIVKGELQDIIAMT